MIYIYIYILYIYISYIYICVCVCVCLCMCKYIPIYIHMHIHVYLYIYYYVCTHVYIHVFSYHHWSPYIGLTAFKEWWVFRGVPSSRSSRDRFGSDEWDPVRISRLGPLLYGYGWMVPIIGKPWENHRKMMVWWDFHGIYPLVMSTACYWTWPFK